MTDMPMVDLDRQLTDEENHSDHLADVLTTLLRYIPEHELHAVAVMGSQITIGRIATGALAAHEVRRKTR